MLVPASKTLANTKAKMFMMELVTLEYSDDILQTYHRLPSLRIWLFIEFPFLIKCTHTWERIKTEVLY